MAVDRAVVMRDAHQTAHGRRAVVVGSRERYAKGTGSCSLRDPRPAPAASVGSRSRERSAWGGRRPCCCVTDDGGPPVSLS